MELCHSRLDDTPTRGRSNESHEQVQQHAQVSLESQAQDYEISACDCSNRCVCYMSVDTGSIQKAQRSYVRHAARGQRGNWNENAQTWSSCAASLSSLLTPWKLRFNVSVAAEPIGRTSAVAAAAASRLSRT